MTSRNTFSGRRGGSFFTEELEMLRHRVWAAAVTALVLIMNFAMVVALTCADERAILLEYAEEIGVDSPEYREQLSMSLKAVANLFNSQGSADFPKVALAVFLAIQGFSWLMDRHQIDFYESQPMPRGRRFVHVIVNSYVLFAAAYLIAMLLGLVIVMLYGFGSDGLVLDALVEFVRVSALYFAAFAYGTVGMMLTGTIFTAILATGVLMYFEYACRSLAEIYASTYYSTWAGSGISFPYLTTLPVGVYENSAMNTQQVVHCFVLAAILLVLACLAYRLRRNEDAGRAVLFAPVRVVVKILLSALAGLMAGIVAEGSQISTGLILVWIVLFAVLCGCIMEIIYHADFRSFFRGAGWTAAGVGIAVLVFCIFRFDLAGYDRWIPSAEKVKDCAVYENMSGAYMRCDEDGNPLGYTEEKFCNQYMHLTETESVLKLMRAGEAYEAYSKNGGISSWGDELDVEELEFCVRMKNGTEHYRVMRVPVDVEGYAASGAEAEADSAEDVHISYADMDAVFGTEQFREGYFQVYHDQYLQESNDGAELSYINIAELQTMKTSENLSLYQEFREAYLKDLTQFSFSFAREHHPIGAVSALTGEQMEEQELIEEQESIEYTSSMEETEDDEEDVPVSSQQDWDVYGLSLYGSIPMQGTFVIYDNFDNTIRFLQKYNLWTESESEDLGYTGLEIFDF